MHRLMFFIWFFLGLWAGWRGDHAVCLLCFVMAEVGLIILKLKYIEQASHSLVKFSVARAKADGYGRKEGE